jgi:diacylglycerol kinase family enzyme
VIGNDETINKVLPQLVEEKVTLGFIPLGPNQSIAQVLGIPEGLPACDVISRRVVRHLDMGRVNTMYFLFSLSAPANVVFDCGDYTVSSLDPSGSFTIHNFASAHTHGSPDDGQVELVVYGKQEDRGWLSRKQATTPSTFSLRQAKITSINGSATVVLDGQLSVKTPATFEVVKGKLDVIVGKQRA